MFFIFEEIIPNPRLTIVRFYAMINIRNKHTSKEWLMSEKEKNKDNSTVDSPYTITENDILQFLIDNSSKGHMVSWREIYAAM